MKRSNRLLKDADFQNILAKKTTYKHHQFVIYGTTNQLGLTRIGLSVSKKLGNAVVRNKIRRQLRMMMIQDLNLQDAVDYLIVVRSDYLKNTFLENKTQLHNGLATLRRKLI